MSRLNPNAPHCATPGVHALILRMMALALNTPSSVADVFIHFSPHCSLLEIDVYDGGWELEKPKALDRSIYTANAEYALSDCARALAALQAHLADLRDEPISTEPDLMVTPLECEVAA